MEKSLLLRHTLFSLILLSLLFPIAYVAILAPWGDWQWDPLLLRVALGAVTQAVLSTLCVVGLGLLGTLGLLKLNHLLSNSAFQVFQFLIVIPSFIPPILIVSLSTKSLGFMPTGLSAVVFSHYLMNVGLVSLLFYQYLRYQALSWIEFARVAGVPRWRLLLKGLLPEMASRIRALSFYFFTLFFFSFSIPFLVGGTLYGGIEVFLYEKVVFYGQWGQAAIYSLLLFIGVLLLSSLVRERRSMETEFPALGSKSLGTFGWLAGAVVPALPLAILLLGLLYSLGWVAQGVTTLDLEALRGTLILGLGVGLSIFVMLSLLSYSYMTGRAAKVLLAFVHPGWVVVGFAFVLLPGSSSMICFFKIIAALCLLYLPFIYRLTFHDELQNLASQVQVTKTFPVSWNRVFFRIVWPQCLPRICLLSAMAGLWACGDFAITGLFVESAQVKTLAFQMQQLLSHYRGDQALLLLWPLLFTSGVVFFAFRGLSYVSSQKTLS